MKDKWLKNIRKDLSDYERKVPDGLWEQICNSTDKQPAAPSENLMSKATFFLKLRRSRFAAAIIFVIIGVGTGIFLSVDNQKNLNLSEVKSPDAYTPSSTGNTWNPLPSSSNNISGQIAKISSHSLVGHFSRTSINSDESETKEDTGDFEKKEESEDLECSGETEMVQNQESTENDRNSGGAELSLNSNLNLNYQPLVRQKSNRSSGSGKFAIGFLAAGIGAIGSNTMYSQPGVNNAGPELINPSITPDQGNSGGEETDIGTSVTDPEDPEDNDDNKGGEDTDKGNRCPRLNNHSSASRTTRGETNEEEKIEDVNYYQPVRFGLTFQYNFTERFGIETGLIYSLLSSETTTLYDGSSETCRQTLHYLGFPINIKTSAFSWKMLELYVSAGATFEKCLANSIKYSYTTYASEAESHNAAKIRPWQLSVNAAAGLQVKMGNWVGFFAEPGISYYFDNHSSVKTLYQKHPWQFNLTLGVRLHFGEW